MASILLIDDEATLREVLRQALERDGHRVLETANGKEALAVSRGVALDLVVTDIVMPEMDGIEVILALVERNPGLPVVAMSGGGLELLLSNAHILGAVSTLAEPFEIDELAAAVRGALGSA